MASWWVMSGMGGLLLCGGLGGRHLSETMVDMGRMIVSYHINQLEDLGLIFKIKHGRENLIHPVSDDLAPGSKEASGAGMFGVGAYGSESMESGEVRA